MENFTYKCPNCNSNIIFDTNKNKWVCSYCNNEYENLFAIEEKKLAEVSTKTTNKCNVYECHKCHKEVYNIIEINNCPTCGSELVKKTDFEINYLFSNDKSKSEIFSQYNKSIKTFQGRISEKYTSPDFELKYINNDLYNGYIRIAQNKIIKKYVFVNLLVPNIEYEDYKFMYEISNMKTLFKNIYCDDKNIDKNLFDYNNKINYNERNDLISDFENECKKNFMEEFALTNDDNIVIDTKINIEKGVLIPFYIAEIDGEKQYILANSDDQMTLKPVLTFKEEKNVRTKIKKYCANHKKVSNICDIATVLSIIGAAQTLILLALTTYIEIINKYFPLVAAILILMIAILIYSRVFLSNYKKDYFYNVKAIKLTKEEYLKQVITNSANVKEVRW